MAKPKTHVLMVVDSSGSMHHLADDVRGGFNSFVEGLRKDTKATFRLTVTVFNTAFTSLCVAGKLADVPELTTANYAPIGGTALLDAVGKTILEFEAANPTLQDGDRVLLVIQTDGQENSSREYTYTDIASMIKIREEAGRWSALFLGATVNAWRQGALLGVRTSQSVQTINTSAGNRAVYDSLIYASSAYASGASAAQVSHLVSNEAGVDTTTS